MWRALSVLVLVALALLLARSRSPEHLNQGLRERVESSVQVEPEAEHAVRDPAAGESAVRREAAIADAGFARLIVRVLELGSWDPVAGVQVEAVLVPPSGSELSERAESAARGEVPLTDEAGMVSFEVLALEQLKVQTRFGHSWSLFDRSTLKSLAPGSVHELNLIFSDQDHGPLFGRVVANVDGHPIALAHVHAGGSPWRRSAAPVAVTDDLGQFELSRMFQDQIVTFTAAGFGPAMASISRQHSTPAMRLEIGLDREAILSGSVRDPGGESRPLRVLLKAKAHEFTQFGRQVGGDSLWIRAVDPSGTFRMESLPANVPLQAEVYSQGERIWAAPTALILEPGEHQDVEWELGGGATLAVSAVEASSGQPIEGLEIWLLPSAEVRRPFFRGFERVAQRATTDWAGQLSFSKLTNGAWSLGPAPLKTPHGRLPSRAAAIPKATQVVITEAASRVDIVLRVDRGRYLEGRVLDPAGRPAAEIQVGALGLDGGGWADTRSIAGGDFRLGPLEPGLYRLTAGGYSSRFASSDPIQVRAGESGVVLSLRPGAEIAGQVVDARTGRGVKCEIGFGNDVWGSTHWSSGSQDGEFAFRAVAAGQYQLVANADNSRVGVLKATVVTPGASVRGLKVELRPGGQVRLRFSGSPESLSYSVWAQGVIVRSGRMRNQVTETFTVPAGPLRVELFQVDRQAGVYPFQRLLERSKEVMVRAGQTTRVDFAVEE